MTGPWQQGFPQQPWPGGPQGQPWQGQQPPKRSRTGLWLGLGIGGLALVLLCGCGGLMWFGMSDSGDSCGDGAQNASSDSEGQREENATLQISYVIPKQFRRIPATGYGEATDNSKVAAFATQPGAHVGVYKAGSGVGIAVGGSDADEAIENEKKLVRRIGVFHPSMEHTDHWKLNGLAGASWDYEVGDGGLGDAWYVGYTGCGGTLWKVSVQNGTTSEVEAAQKIARSIRKLPGA